MNSNPVFNSVQQLLSQGDTGQALQVLIAFLEKDASRPDILRTLRVVEANYNAARQQEIKGILEFSEAQREYAKSNDALLSVLEDLASGRKPSQGLSGTGDGGSRNPLLPWLIGGGILVVLGIVAGLWFSRAKRPKTNPGQAIEQAKVNGPQCPNFRSAGFKVLVLEFQKLSGDDSNPALGIQTRIRDLTTRNNVDTDVEILSANQFGNNTPDLREASGLGKNCQADMIIWGQYEQANQSLEVDIRYAFTNPDWPPGAAIQKFKNVSELKADRMKITNLDEAVFRLCTAMALRENRLDLAEKWLNKIQNPTAREQKWKEMIKK